MADVFSESKRSSIMAQVRSKDTKPELVVRSILHRLGYRFRIHRKGLPGKPDIVLPKHSTVIFVNGCFWHGHPDCKRSSLPKSRQDFWKEKIEANVERDRRAQEKLTKQGWNVVIVWQCQISSESDWAKSLMESIHEPRKDRLS